MTEENEQQILVSDPEIAATHRVKFYQLNIDTNWEDKGTGSCTYQVGTDGKPDQIIVHSEEDDSILLKSDVLKRRLYQRQQDTLIVWTEEDNRDLALSFQDPAGCEEMWHNINKKQGNVGSVLAGDAESDDLTPLARVSPDITLPDPELSNLKEIATTLTNAHLLSEKDKLSAYIISESYFEKLFPLLETLEDLEVITDLNHLYNILVGILNLNDQQTIEIMLQDDHITSVMGILEYNPKTPGMKAKHREFIKTHGNVKHVVEITDEHISRKIDQTFRLEYLQGIFLHSESSDEGLMGVINNMIYQNHLEIINYIQNNDLLLAEIFSTFKDPDTAVERRTDAIRFVHQLCNLTKPMQNSARVNMFRSLAPFGLFELIAASLSHDIKSLRLNGLNILFSFTDLDVTSIRSHIIMQARDSKVKRSLLDVIVEQAVKDGDYDAKVQYFEMLRLLLDPNGNAFSGPPGNDPMSKQAPDTDELLTLFYEKYAKILVQPIESIEIKPMALKGPIEPLKLTQDQAQLCLYVCDFFTFAVRNHGFRCKFDLIGQDTFKKVAQLYRSKYAYVKLVALRFFRACVTLSDDFYNLNLVKQNIFEPTIRLLLDTDGKDCLLNSACLDLIEHIRRENIKFLINHLINQFGTVLDTITYISTCKQLRLKFEQNNEVPESSQDNVEESSSGDSFDKKANTDGWSLSTIDNEEEEYFNGSDEEDNVPPQVVKPTIPLVGYGDDDDDDEEDEEEEGVEKTTQLPSESPSADIPMHEDSDASSDTSRKSTKRTTDDAEIETENSFSPPPFKARKTEEDDDDDDVLAKRAAHQSTAASTGNEESVNEPTFKSRKLKEADEDDDDAFAKRSSRPIPPSSPKKMVIKTSANKKLGTSQ